MIIRPRRKRLDQVKSLIPQMVIKQFAPGHHFLAEERPERVAELVSEWVAGLGAGRDASRDLEYGLR